MVEYFCEYTFESWRLLIFHREDLRFFFHGKKWAILDAFYDVGIVLNSMSREYVGICSVLNEQRLDFPSDQFLSMSPWIPILPLLQIFFSAALFVLRASTNLQIFCGVLGTGRKLGTARDAVEGGSTPWMQCIEGRLSRNLLELLILWSMVPIGTLCCKCFPRSLGVGTLPWIRCLKQPRPRNHLQDPFPSADEVWPIQASKH